MELFLQINEILLKQADVSSLYLSAYWLPYIQKFWAGTNILKDDPTLIILQIPLPIPAIGSSLNIQLVMRANYPDSPPQFYATSDLVSPGIIDETNKRIRHPMLDTWSNQVSLTEVIKNIHIAFNNNPPQPRYQTQASYKPAGYVGPSGAAPIAQNAEEKKKEQKKMEVPQYKLDEVKIPKIELDMIKPRLESLDYSQLRDLDENLESLQNFFAEEEGVVLIQAKINSYQEMLHSLAESNLESKNELSILNESMDVQFGSLEKAQERSKELRNLMVATTANVNPKQVQNILYNRAKEADQVSEVCKKSFLNGEFDHKKFQREYVKQRKEFHYYSTLAKTIEKLGS